jgi:hypothetical protein
MENTDLYRKGNYADSGIEYYYSYKTRHNYHRVDRPCMCTRQAVSSKEGLIWRYYYTFIINNVSIGNYAIDLTSQKPHPYKINIHLKEK